MATLQHINMVKMQTDSKIQKIFTNCDNSVIVKDHNNYNLYKNALNQTVPKGKFT